MNTKNFWKILENHVFFAEIIEWRLQLFETNFSIITLPENFAKPLEIGYSGFFGVTDYKSAVRISKWFTHDLYMLVWDCE